MQRRDVLRTFGALAAQALVPNALSARGSRKTMEVGVQLYLLREEMRRNPEATIARIATLGYSDVEWWGKWERTPAQLRGLLDANGLRSTAVHVDPATGTAEVFATADHPTPYAYFMEPSGPPLACKPGEPLSTAPVTVYRLGPGGRFDLGAWKGTGGIAYTLRAKDGVLQSSRGGNY